MTVVVYPPLGNRRHAEYMQILSLDQDGNTKKTRSIKWKNLPLKIKRDISSARRHGAVGFPRVFASRPRLEELRRLMGGSV